MSRGFNHLPVDDYNLGARLSDGELMRIPKGKIPEGFIRVIAIDIGYWLRANLKSRRLKRPKTKWPVHYPNGRLKEEFWTLRRYNATQETRSQV